MKRGYRSIGIVFLIVVVLGGFVALYEMHRAEREERIREELREAQETRQTLRDENRKFSLQLGEVRKARQALVEENKNLRRFEAELKRLKKVMEQDREESKRKRREDEKSFKKELEDQIRTLEELKKKLAPWPGEIEPRRWNPMDDRYQEVPHPDATKRQRRTFS